MTINKALSFCILPLLLFSQTGTAQQNNKPWTLRECIEYARQHNLQIRGAKITRENRMIDGKQAKAQRFPSLVFTSNQGWGHQKIQQTDGSLNSASAYSGDYVLNANMTIYNGQKLSRAIEQEEKNIQIADYQVAVNGNDTEVSVTEAYLQILYANEALKTNRQTLENSLAQLNRSKGLLDAGSISASDHAQIEAQYNNDNYRVIQAENTLTLNKLQLKQLLELELEEKFEITFPELDEAEILTPVPSLESVYSTALRVMPEIKSSQLGIESASLEEKIAAADRLPNISLSASLGTNNDSEAGKAFTRQINDRLSEKAGLQISIPISNRRQIKSAVSRAKLQTETAKLDNINTRKNLLRTVETLHQDLLSAQSRYVAATHSLKAASLSYQLAQEEFEAGMRNTVELLTEKNNYLSAMQEQIQAKYQAILARRLLNFYQNEPIHI